MLDGGPSRKSQAMQGRASMRLGSSGRQQEAVQPAPSQSSQGDAVLAPRLDTVSQPQRRSSRLPFIGVLVGAILVVILTIGWALCFLYSIR